MANGKDFKPGRRARAAEYRENKNYMGGKKLLILFLFPACGGIQQLVKSKRHVERELNQEGQKLRRTNVSLRIHNLKICTYKSSSNKG